MAYLFIASLILISGKMFTEFSPRPRDYRPRYFNASLPLPTGQVGFGASASEKTGYGFWPYAVCSAFWLLSFI